MREKRLPFTDGDDPDEEEEEPTKRPRTRFVELQPSAVDPADGIDDEIPGSTRADVDPLVLGGKPFEAHAAGHLGRSAGQAAADAGFARAQRAHLRQQRQDQGALAEALKAQEGCDQPEEIVNEVGEAMEPFHLRRELEEGYFDPAGNYLEYAREEEEDAWLESIEDEKVAGVGPDSSRRLPYPNEPVADPPPLRSAELAPYWLKLVELLQPGETVPAALRRLAGAGPVLDKFGSKEEARQFFQDRVRSGHAVPPGNHEEFEALTEAAEVLFDHGQTDVYSSSREQLAARLEAAEKAPPAAAPSRGAAREVAAQFGGGSGEAAAVDAAGAPGPGGRGRRHKVPPSAGPAAAAEPPVSADRPSVPSAERTAATTRGSAGVRAAALGFAAQVPADVAAEAATAAPPPQEVELGLGQLTAAPTAVELQSKAHVAVAVPVASRGAGGSRAGREHFGGAGEGVADDDQLEAAFQEGLAGRGRAGSGGRGAGAGVGAPVPPSEAATVALLGEVVQTDSRDEMAATLAGRLGSVQRLAQQEAAVLQGAPAGQQAAQGKPAAVAFDNEQANLAGSVPSMGTGAELEE
ncbi:hypothetical protein ABPG75_004815 [Micractinium tetrahymenae]